MTIVVHGRGPEERDQEFPSQEQLADALERIHEEVRVARLLARQAALPEALASHMVSSLREALLMRIFRLRHFFYGRPEEEMELVASDFFPAPSDWIRHRPSAPPHLSRWLDDLAEWVDEHVCVRPEGRVPQSAWPLSALVETLSAVHAAFCEAIVEYHENSFVNIPWPQASEQDIVSNLSQTSPPGSSDHEDTEADL